MYKVKKHENLYLQYWLNLRQVAEKKTHYVQTSTRRKGKRKENLKQLFGKVFLIYTKSTLNEAHH